MFCFTCQDTKTRGVPLMTRRHVYSRGYQAAEKSSSLSGEALKIFCRQAAKDACEAAGV